MISTLIKPEVRSKNFVRTTRIYGTRRPEPNLWFVGFAAEL